MSKIKIQGSSSGTGTLTIQAPTTSTDRTLNIPDSSGTLLDENSSVPAANLTGTVADARISALTASKLTGALPAISGASLTGITTGKVLQVISTTSSTYTHPSTSWVDISSSSITITPSATSSKILYIYNTGGFADDAIQDCSLRLYRDSTVVLTSARYGYMLNTEHVPFSIHYTFLDSPNTTSAVTYKMQAKEQNAGNWEINDSQTGVVMVMEIAG
jgi:hypothetical protein